MEFMSATIRHDVSLRQHAGLKLQLASMDRNSGEQRHPKLTPYCNLQMEIFYLLSKEYVVCEFSILNNQWNQNDTLQIPRKLKVQTYSKVSCWRFTSFLTTSENSAKSTRHANEKVCEVIITCKAAKCLLLPFHEIYHHYRWHTNASRRKINSEHPKWI